MEAKAAQPIELKVEYKRLNAFIADYVRNISRGGTFVKTSRPLSIGTEFMFRLVVPSIARPLMIHGEVNWVVAVDDASQTPGMGIRFVYRQGDSAESISHIVDKVMIESLGESLHAKLMEESKRGSRE